MVARIISVVNQKGGSGKTTLCMQLAGALGLSKVCRVLVVDADPQATATRWAKAAPEEKPFPAGVIQLSAMDGKIHREVQRLVRDYDFILIDCPPSIDSLVPQSALLISDLALVPIIPSPPDLWSFVGVRQLIANANAFNEKLIARLVVNNNEPHTTLAQESLDILKEFNFPVCSTYIGHRTAYRQSAILGGTVHDFGSRAAPAIAEIDALVKELHGLLQQPAAEKGAAAV